jgi:imidazolonepropionase-like amidohydrolase
MSQIDAFVEAGIPARVILQAMTTNAARLLGVDKERGAIAPGQFADIVATPDNPLEDARALTRIDFVMKNGRVIRQPQ